MKDLEKKSKFRESAESIKRERDFSRRGYERRVGNSSL